MPGQLNDECELTEGGNRVSSFGHRSADGKHCEVQRRVNVRKGGKVVRTEIKTERVAIGRTLYRDPETGFVCTQARARDRRDCPLAVSPEQNRPMTNAEQFGYGGAKELVNRVTGAAHAVQAGAEVLSDPAKLSTRAEHTREKAGPGRPCPSGSGRGDPTAAASPAQIAVASPPAARALCAYWAPSLSRPKSQP